MISTKKLFYFTIVILGLLFWAKTAQADFCSGSVICGNPNVPNNDKSYLCAYAYTDPSSCNAEPPQNLCANRFGEGWYYKSNTCSWYVEPTPTPPGGNFSCCGLVSCYKMVCGDPNCTIYNRDDAEYQCSVYPSKDVCETPKDSSSCQTYLGPDWIYVTDSCSWCDGGGGGCNPLHDNQGCNVVGSGCVNQYYWYHRYVDCTEEYTCEGSCSGTPPPGGFDPITIQGSIAVDQAGGYEKVVEDQVYNGDCGTFQNITTADLTISYSGVSSGAIDYQTGCTNDPDHYPFYSGQLYSAGNYTFTINNLPLNYSIVFLNSNPPPPAGCAIIDRNTVTCPNLAEGGTYTLWFYVRQTVPSCTLSAIYPNGTPYGIPYNQTNNTFLAAPIPSNGPIDEVRFQSSNSVVLDPDSVVDTTGPSYQGAFNATGAVGTTTTLTARVYMGGLERCSAQTPIRITNPNAWWQVINGDVFTPINLDSEVLTGQYFYQTIAGGFPGVPLAGNILIDPNRISENYNWNAETAYGGDVYNFAYFKQKVADVYDTFYELTSNNFNGSNFATRGTNWPVGSNYYWAKATANPDGNLTITGTVGTNWPANRKVILFVERNGTLSVNINKVDIDLGTNLFMVITNGRIIYPTSSSGVQEGIYFADQKIITETTGNNSDNDLDFFGTFIGWGGFELNRSLSNNANPAETFTFSPAQVMQIPTIFGQRSIIWKEVAP